MNNDVVARSPFDYGYVDLRTEPECRYWMRELGCTEQQLRDAVAAVGPLVVDVKRHIGKELESADRAPEKTSDRH